MTFIYFDETAKIDFAVAYERRYDYAYDCLGVLHKNANKEVQSYFKHTRSWHKRRHLAVSK